MTSSDVVVYLRRMFKVKKVGHAGTLDPNAAGVLIVCIGKATKISEYLMEFNKTYKGGIVLGKETDTLDADGEITNESGYIPTETEIKEAFNKFKGRQLQIPPMYSARKHKGKRLYELARQGLEVKVTPRQIEIFECNLLDISNGSEIFFEIKCTKGTYIRSLARDIGKHLGCGAYLSYLIRTSIETFTLEDSYTLQEVKSAHLNKGLRNLLIPMDKALPKLDSIILHDNAYLKVLNGNPIKADFIISGSLSMEKGALLKIYCRDCFMGLGYTKNNMLYMRKVLG